MSKAEQKQAEVKSFDPNAVKVTAAVTLPVLSQKIARGETSRIIHVFIASAFVEKEIMEEEKNEKTGEIVKVPKMTTTCAVINMEDSRPYVIVVSAVMIGNMGENYPNQSYVGKCFRVESKGKKEGKRYNEMAIDEIDPQGIDFTAIAESYGVLKMPEKIELDNKAK